ncbi:radical SAM protein [Bengtsoniella intestinalis]|uniref:radical SAM protein n=1 Tax=Bengtsoniella intestinalis TaxID=3073143 RepID=UPI00391F5CDD
MKHFKTNLQPHDSVIVFGVDMATEPLMAYCRTLGKKIAYVAVEKMTVPPQECGKIPSRRMCKRNAFSETDMMMDTTIGGTPVVRLDAIPMEERQVPLLVLENGQGGQVASLAQTLGYSQVCFVSEATLEAICNELYTPAQLHEALWDLHQTAIGEMQTLRNCLQRQLRPTAYDFHFEFHLVDHCNLKCRGCTHFAPLAEESFLDVEEFRKDIARLSFLTKKRARFINLLGGEPLLHPQAEQFGAIARAYFPDTTIRIVTNGILLEKMSPTFWKTCALHNIEIGVTQYPVDVDYEAGKALAEQYHVPYISFSGEGVREELWKLSLDEKGQQRPIENFMHCPRPNACVFCAHGRLYPCATMANIQHYNRFFNKNLALSSDDSIDIHQAQSAQEIFEFLKNPTPFCRYCNIDKREYGLTWRPSEQSISEWS